MKRLLVVAILLSSSCAWWWRDAVPLAGGDVIKVPHERHRAGGVECLACHETLYDQKSLAQPTLPAESVCLQCHAAEKQKGNCGFCHTDVRKAAPWPARAPALQMSHAEHIERTKEKCTVCHTRLPEPVRTSSMAPAMAACLSCHEHRQEYDDGRCQRCHTDLSRYPLAPVSLYSHRGDFVHEHARPARAAGATCAECHEQTFCSDCHASTVATRIEVKLPERVDANFIHRNDYVGRHQVEAAADPAQCRRCHGSSFCENCHRAQNLSSAGANPRDPHPPGWSLPGSQQFHGTAARRDIVACAACHDQGARSICVDCHKVGGIGGNPHPPGWTSRHGVNEIARNGMCAACHL
ncbi:MAG: hypothetical protein JWN44_5470 [Myxococcales bacterium]|nr:hypothetical protein [Myxococcales bacterium]